MNCRWKRDSLFDIIICFCVAFLPVSASSETIEVTDDLGRVVNVPSEPKRVFGANDALITHTLRELGVPMIGSIGWIDLINGESSIPGYAEQHGVSPEDDGLTVIAARGAVGLETLAALEPDLLIATGESVQDVLPQLESISPVFLCEFSRDAWSIYECVARATGRTEMYMRHREIFEARLQNARNQIDVPPGTTFSFVRADLEGTITPGAYPYLTYVLEGLGLEESPLMQEISDTASIQFSYERLADLDADFIFVPFRESSYQLVSQTGETLTNAVPIWCDVLSACRNGRMVLFSQTVTVTGTFAGMSTFLEIAQSHLATRFVPGGPGLGEGD